MAGIDEALTQIDDAFGAAPRPSDEDLLHEDCRDDNDIAALYAYAHWRDVPGDVLVTEYAALSFLSPAGYRHFIPAYMRHALQHFDSGESVVDSTLWSLALNDWEDERMRAFRRSKWSLLDAPQRAAVVAFLRAADALAGHDDDDVARALATWTQDAGGEDDDDAAAVAARAEATAAGEATAEAWLRALNARDAAALADLMAPGVRMIAVADARPVAAGLDALDRLLRSVDERIGPAGALTLTSIMRIHTTSYALLAEAADGTPFAATLDVGGDDGRIVTVSHAFMDPPSTPPEVPGPA